MAAHVIKANIEKIIGLQGNNKCGDCGVDVDKNNGWASMTFGTIICVECAGAHRNIPGNQIRSFLLDTNAWNNNKNVDFLSKIGGNTSANNNVWECHLPYFCINGKRDRFDEFGNRDKSAIFRRLLIQNKYENQLFIPLSQNDYFTEKNQAIIKVPIDPMSQKLILLWNVNGKKKWTKKPLYICVHSNYFSVYGNNKIKKKKCDHIKTYDLIPMQVTVHRTDPYDDDDDFYEFQIIYPDEKEEEKEEDADQFGYGADDDDEDIFLRGRVKDLDLFCKIVHEMRKTIAYYQMYKTLVNIDDIEIYPIKKAIDCKQLKQSKQYVGCGKLFGGSSLHFYVVDDILYTFKANPLLATDGELQAQNAWNLQKIDLQQDPQGIRTGIKGSVIIIEPFKLLSVKFENEKTSIVFYHKLRKLWRRIRGNYLCDFKPQIPVIMDENKEKEEISFARSPRSSTVDRLDFSRVKSKALKNERPKEILEILAKIENIDVEPLPLEESEESEESEDEDEDEELYQPKEAPAIKHQDTFEKMREMHRKMSTPILKAQKSPPVASGLPKVNEESLEEQAQQMKEMALNANNQSGLPKFNGSNSLPQKRVQMQEMSLNENDGANESHSLPKREQKAVALAFDDKSSALNSYQKARLRQKRKRKQTEPIFDRSAARKQANNNSNKNAKAVGMDVNVNRAFIDGLKMKEKKTFPMRKRKEYENKSNKSVAAVVDGAKSNEIGKMQKAKEAKVPMMPPPNPVEVQRQSVVSNKHKQVKSQEFVIQEQQKQIAKEMHLRKRKDHKQKARSVDYGNMNVNAAQNVVPNHAQNIQNIPGLHDNKSGSPPISPLIQSRSSEAKPMNARDAPMMKKKAKPKMAKWNCRLCTFENKAMHNACAICGAKRHQEQRQPQAQQPQQPVAHSMSMSMNMYPHVMQQQQQQQQQPPQDPTMLMLFHQQEFQKYFQQQQFPQNMNRSQLQQVQQLANYHYQQYMMLYQRYQQQSLSNFRQQQPSLSFMPQQAQQQPQQLLQQKQPPQKRKSKPKPQKQNKLLQKRKAGVQMQYLKLERYFVMNDHQKNSLSQNSYAIQQSIGHLARLDIALDIGCYKLTIASSIPLPRRKAHWQNVLKSIRECIGMSMEHIVQ